MVASVISFLADRNRTLNYKNKLSRLIADCILKAHNVIVFNKYVKGKTYYIVIFVSPSIPYLYCMSYSARLVNPVNTFFNFFHIYINATFFHLEFNTIFIQHFTILCDILSSGSSLKFKKKIIGTLCKKAKNGFKIIILKLIKLNFFVY